MSEGQNQQEVKKGKTSSTALLVTGIFIIVAAQVVNHYMQLRDLYNGVLTGIGIGLMLLALMQWKRWRRN